jgi:uncharacterized protein GlcG (DUF336 family)
MSRIRSHRASLSCGLLGALLALPAAGDDTLVSFKSLAPEVALEAAQAALQHCRVNGYQVSVAVVDRMGITQVVLRDRFAGAHTPDSAMRKAATAASFRADTLSLAGNTSAGTPHSGARFIDGILMLGGGIPISAAGSIVAAIGVAGAPSSTEDHACAQAGIDSVKAKLELAD